MGEVEGKREVRRGKRKGWSGEEGGGRCDGRGGEGGG